MRDKVVIKVAHHEIRWVYGEPGDACSGADVTLTQEQVKWAMQELSRFTVGDVVYSTDYQAKGIVLDTETQNKGGFSGDDQRVAIVLVTGINRGAVAPWVCVSTLTHSSL